MKYEQLSLPIKDVEFLKGMTPYEKFMVFHEANPHVLEAIVKTAMIAVARGRTRWSINGIFEVLRWSTLETIGEPWKLNNTYRAYYARLAEEVEPSLSGFFRTRKSKADE